MKLFLLLVLIATTIVSCSSESGHRVPSTAERIVKELYVTDSGEFIALPAVQARRIDTMYRIGDTLLSSGEYVVIVR